MKRILLGVIFAAVYFFVAYTLPAQAALPTGFTDQSVTAGLALPTDFAFAPDGRIFIATKNGEVFVFKNNALLEIPALDMTISTGGDRGLLSIALDPNFSTNKFIYLLYTSISNQQRISRFTMTGDTISPASEVVILQNPRTWSGFLNAGALRFGPDGKLYASFGSDGQGAIAQDLSALEGKFIRINPDGTTPSDNPFFGIPGFDQRIFSYGFRNPWRFNFDHNGKAIMGDVGEDLFEKIVRAERGANYGWPNSEGDCRPSCGSVTPPLHVYPHDPTGGAAVVSGITYTAAQFPASYLNTYFFGDYVGGFIKQLVFNSAGDVSSVNPFAENLGALAGINQGADGCMYYLIIFPGELRKICHGNVGITVEAHADKTFGALPLAVQFSALSGAPDASFTWDFGDGSTGSGASPTHTYTAKGVYSVEASATNSSGSATTKMTIWAGFLPPAVEITSPIGGSKYSAGDTIAFSGSASDESGPIPAANLKWTFIFHHNDHIHLSGEEVGIASGHYVIPRTGESSADTWYEFELIATNSVGLSAKKSVLIHPNTALLKLGTSPSGLKLLLDDQPITTPYETLGVIGFERKISATDPQTLGGTSYEFSSWSDGGSKTHTFFTPPGTTTYIASYHAVAEPVITATIKMLQETYSGGEPLSAEVTLLSNKDLDVLVDIELWSSVKSGQIFPVIHLSAGVAETFNIVMNAPGTPGSYVMKVGIFNPDWSHLYLWKDNAATLSVMSAGEVPLEFTAGAIADKTSYTTAESPKITTIARANKSIAGVLIDTELWGPGGKAGQKVVTADLVANTDFSSLWDAGPLPVGMYTIKVGLFSADWSTLYKWNDTAGTFSVTSGSAPPPAFAFAVSAGMPASTFSPGATGTITTKVTATGAISDALIDTELYDIHGNKVGQNVVTTSLAANTQHEGVWNLTLPSAPGTYIVKVGIFSSDWSTFYFWKNNAFQFTIGSAPSDPTPGETYPITIFVPEDNSTVSGVVEIKAAIPELNIHSYNIGWRTGTGEYFTLDTDPVTQGFKHAWIDFSPWTWMPDGIYPLEFQATDLSGNVIGYKMIHVRVLH